MELTFTVTLTTPTQDPQWLDRVADAHIPGAILNAVDRALKDAYADVFEVVVTDNDGEEYR